MNLIILSLIALPFITGAIIPLLERKRPALLPSLVLLSTFASIVLAVGLYYDTSPLNLPGIMSLGLSFSAQSLQIVLTFLASLVFFFSALANQAYFKDAPHMARFYSFFLITQGALFAVFLSADLFTTFIFFELMSLTSWVWVAQNETRSAIDAANTYLAIAIGGGMVMLLGLFLLFSRLGTLEFTAIANGMSTLSTPSKWLIALCLTVGFGAKAGVFPLHIWLPKAHPEAPAPASSLLSGILTKSGIFGLFLVAKYVMRGNLYYAIFLLFLGCLTMLLGAILALLTDNLKRTLACSSLSQIGFITVAIALVAADLDIALAAGGALIHVINHALTKAVLFLSGGILYTRLQTNDLNKLKGSGYKDPILTFSFFIAGLSLAGLPGLAGYISKTLIHEGLVENIPLWAPAAVLIVEKLFVIAGGLTFAYMSKLFILLFVNKPSTPKEKSRLDFKSAISVLIPALGLLVFGALPNTVYNEILHFTAPWFNTQAHEVLWFDPINLQGAAISLGIGLLTYLLVVRKFLLAPSRANPVRNISLALDLENHVYKPFLKVFTFTAAFVARLLYSTSGWLLTLMQRTLFHNPNPVVIEGTDDHFGLYSVSYVPPGRYAQTLALELMLFGIGLIFTLFYLFLINGI